MRSLASHTVSHTAGSQNNEPQRGDRREPFFPNTMSSTRPTAPAPSPALRDDVREKAKTLRLAGWVGFWLELFALFVIILSLVFAITGRGFSDESNAGIGFGMFLATVGGLGAAFAVVLSYRFARIGKRLLDPRYSVNTSKSDTLQLLRVALVAGLAGLAVSLIGGAVTSSVLVAKTVSQPPGTTLTEASHAVRALDALVMVATLNGIAAHFVELLQSLWLQHRLRESES